MYREQFLKLLAEKGYDIGFGAKVNFASFDIINKIPSWVGLISLVIGILQIAYPNMPYNKELSVLLIFMGIAIIYLEVFKKDINKYEKEGIRLTKIFHQIKTLYHKAKCDNNFDYKTYEVEYKNILDDFYSNNISNHVFSAHWLAHFKFFYEMQIDWIDSELRFTFFKDKLPGSLKMLIYTILLIIIIIFLYGHIGNF